jgi:hypothetical protein
MGIGKMLVSKAKTDDAILLHNKSTSIRPYSMLLYHQMLPVLPHLILTFLPHGPLLLGILRDHLVSVMNLKKMLKTMALRLNSRGRKDIGPFFCCRAPVQSKPIALGHCLPLHFLRICRQYLLMILGRNHPLFQNLTLHIYLRFSNELPASSIVSLKLTP